MSTIFKNPNFEKQCNLEFNLFPIYISKKGLAFWTSELDLFHPPESQF